MDGIIIFSKEIIDRKGLFKEIMLLRFEYGLTNFSVLRVQKKITP